MKERLEEQTMALRVAKEFKDRMTINLGFGIPTQAANFIPEGIEVIFHAENGCLGYGPMPTRPEDEDFHLVNATGTFVTPRPGMCFFDHAESFTMIRGRHIDLCVLGALQVSEKGDLANWTIQLGRPGNIGGAMDLAFGAHHLIAVMTHTTKNNEPKILKQCTYPLTAPRCVNLIVTDIAVIEVTPDGLLLKETAPGWTAQEVQALTEPKLKIAKDLKQMELENRYFRLLDIRREIKELSKLGGISMKWVVKECPQCGNKMVLVTANLFFRPKALFNLHCERCKNILEYGSEKFTTDAKSLHTDEFVDLLSLLVNSK